MVIKSDRGPNKQPQNKVSPRKRLAMGKSISKVGNKQVKGEDRYGSQPSLEATTPTKKSGL